MQGIVSILISAVSFRNFIYYVGGKSYLHRRAYAEAFNAYGVAYYLVFSVAVADKITFIT